MTENASSSAISMHFPSRLSDTIAGAPATASRVSIAPLQKFAMSNSEPSISHRLDSILSRIGAASARAGHGKAELLAVSKLQPPEAIAQLHAAGQRRFGENYVQEALAKQLALGGTDIEWHLIGPLQSNKARQAASHFDWIHSIDRAKLVPLLADARAPSQAPLNLLIQVNIDDEQSKSGCRPEQIEGLAEAINAQPRLRLRGLMAIPKPQSDGQSQTESFRHMRALFETLQRRFPQVDTLSMGMSGDFEQAIAEGANLVRVGTALFGARPAARGG